MVLKFSENGFLREVRKKLNWKISFQLGVRMNIVLDEAPLALESDPNIRHRRHETPVVREAGRLRTITERVDQPHGSLGLVLERCATRKDAVHGHLQLGDFPLHLLAICRRRLFPLELFHTLLEPPQTVRESVGDFLKTRCHCRETPAWRP